MGGEDTNYAQVADLMPRRVKKRRKIETEDGSDQGWEEYFDYIFPEDEAAKPNLKLLAMAKMWKKKKDVDPEDQDENATDSTNTEEVEKNDENIDADDQDIVNESSSDSEDESNDKKESDDSSVGD